MSLMAKVNFKIINDFMNHNTSLNPESPVVCDVIYGDDTEFLESELEKFIIKHLMNSVNNEQKELNRDHKENVKTAAREWGEICCPMTNKSYPYEIEHYDDKRGNRLIFKFV